MGHVRWTVKLQVRTLSAIDSEGRVAWLTAGSSSLKAEGAGGGTGRSIPLELLHLGKGDPIYQACM